MPRCPIQFERTLDSEGRYLGYFDRKEEAEEFVKEQVHRYLFAPNPKKMSIQSICKEAQARGIKLHPATFAKELRRNNIEIRDRKKTTTSKTFSISKVAWSHLQEYPRGSRSFLVDLGVKVVMGIPTQDIAVFIPGQTTLIFEKKSENRFQLYVGGELDSKLKKQVHHLLQLVEKEGTKAVIKYAKEHGYAYVGGTNI